jgi:4-amino-4-deoxy-L-arabinose transferase-like glycosyltransferase
MLHKDRYFIYLLAAILLLCCAGILGRDIITRGEGREALVAQSMVKSGDWVLPTGYASDIPSKPPFLHWLISIFSLPIGEVTETTARLPSAFAFALATLIFYFFLQNRFDQKTAFYTAAILITSFEWCRSGVSCRVDMVFSALFFCGLLSFYKWHEKKFEGIPVAAIFCLSCAVLGKGPVAIVLPALIFTIYLLLQKENYLRILWKVSLILIPSMLISCVWYFLAYSHGGEAFFNKVYYENFQRFTGTMEDEPHKHGLFYLLGTIPLGLMPWSLIALILFIIGYKKKENSKITFGSSTDFKKFSLISVLTVVIFFCIPASKREVYLLPVYPFFALFLARFFIAREKKLFFLNTFFVFVFVATVGQYFVIRPYSNGLSPRPFALTLKKEFSPEIQIYSYLNEFYALSFYMDRKLYRLDVSNLPKEALVVAYKDRLDRVSSDLKLPFEIKLESENNVEKPVSKLIALKIKN